MTAVTWVCPGPFWVLTAKPASLFTGLYSPSHWEGRQQQKKREDLIQRFKDVAAGFADGGSR